MRGERDPARAGLLALCVLAMLSAFASPTAAWAQPAAADGAPQGSSAPSEGAAAEGSPQAQELETIHVPQREEPAPVEAEASGKVRLEEVVVRAQKRLQGQRDVPISMSVMNEAFIRAQGITDIADALRFVPNFKVVELFNKTTPQCRGFTIDDVNPAFEPPCGVGLDGVAYTRASYFSAGLFDIERIEVLRGPQGTTFGKNTTAGVVSLYSKEPTDAFNGKVDLQYGLSGPGLWRAEGAVGGPIIARAAMASWKTPTTRRTLLSHPTSEDAIAPAIAQRWHSRMCWARRSSCSMNTPIS
jgi:iron complex outermembrane receptor protein